MSRCRLRCVLTVEKFSGTIRHSRLASATCGIPLIPRRTGRHLHVSSSLRLFSLAQMGMFYSLQRMRNMTGCFKQDPGLEISGRARLGCSDARLFVMLFLSFWPGPRMQVATSATWKSWAGMPILPVFGMHFSIVIALYFDPSAMSTSHTSLLLVLWFLWFTHSLPCNSHAHHVPNSPLIGAPRQRGSFYYPLVSAVIGLFPSACTGTDLSANKEMQKCIETTADRAKPPTL